MFHIKRTKTATLPDALAPGVIAMPGREPTTAIHWAAKIAPEGNVVVWARDQAEALAVAEEIARKVVDFHANLPNVGKIESVSAGAEATKAASVPVAPEQPLAVAATVRRLTDQIAALQQQLTAATREKDEAVTENRCLSEEVTSLKDKIATLESDLEAATESDKTPAKRGPGRPKKTAHEDHTEDHKPNESSAG